MSASVEYAPCPHCGDIRNVYGTKTHIKLKHPEAVTV